MLIWNEYKKKFVDKMSNENMLSCLSWKGKREEQSNEKGGECIAVGKRKRKEEKRKRKEEKIKRKGRGGAGG